MDGARGDAIEMRAALLRMRRSGLLPVAFGGLVPSPAAETPGNVCSASIQRFAKSSRLLASL